MLRDLSLYLPPGSFHFLTGASGAGKSTLLRLMYLGERPTRGLISLFGEDMSRMKRSALAPIRRRVGVVVEDLRLVDHR